MKKFQGNTIEPWRREYEPQVKNTENLPCGLNARYLKCLIAHNGELIAKSWHHKQPVVDSHHLAFRF